MLISSNHLLYIAFFVLGSGLLGQDVILVCQSAFAKLYGLLGGLGEQVGRLLQVPLHTILARHVHLGDARDYHIAWLAVRVYVHVAGVLGLLARVVAQYAAVVLDRSVPVDCSCESTRQNFVRYKKS